MKLIALSLALLAAGLTGGAWADDKTCDKDFAAAVEEKVAEFKAQKPKPAVDEALAWDVARSTRDADFLSDWTFANFGIRAYQDGIRLTRLGIAVGLEPRALAARMEKALAAERAAGRLDWRERVLTVPMALIELSILTGEPMEKINVDYDRARAQSANWRIPAHEIVRASYLSGRSLAHIQSRYRALYNSPEPRGGYEEIKLELIKLAFVFDRSFDRIVTQYEELFGKGLWSQENLFGTGGWSQYDCAHFVALLNIQLWTEKEIKAESHLIHRLTGRGLDNASEREIQKTVALLRLLRLGVAASDPRVMALF